ncbi:MAG: UvrD-helicase domain-containing protein, partial [Eubacteriales bacterium]|nr:UvrD-helicase domain-containing protein [Eubacteriales bacterium]
MIKKIKIWKRIAEKWQGGLPRREGTKNAILSVIHTGKKHKKPTPAKAPHSPVGKAPHAPAGKAFSKRQALPGATNAEKPTESDVTSGSCKNLSEDRLPESPSTGNPPSEASLYESPSTGKLLSEASLPGDIRAVLALGESLAALDRSDTYVARSDYLRLITNTRKDLQDLQVLRSKNLLDYYCRQNGMPSSDPVDKILLLCSEAPVTLPLDHSASDPTAASSRDTAAPAAPRLQALFDAHNARFLSHALEKEKDYLDHVLDAVDPRIRLDETQRRMVLTDEDNCLVIAGAGAGKTTSVAAKVKYLVDRKNIRPEEILVISFTNKAVDELRTRIQKDLNIPCPIATFHSAGNAVLHMHDPERINIVDADKKFFVIRDYFRGNILRDERLVHSLILFFASYFDAPLNENDLEAFFRGIAQMRYTSMKSELGEYCAEIMDVQTRKKVTIRNEIMRSSQEVEIANFLYRNGIDYVYEPVYRYHIEMAKKPYTPDFLIRQGDREIYLEHFGITQDGQNNRYDLQRLQAYKDAVNNKIRLHRQHGTELIYTFSGYRDGRSLTEHLEGELRAHGVEFHPRSEEEILQKILQNAENRYVRKLILLICRFITNFKTDGYTEMQFAVMKESTTNVRTRLFLDICQACYLEYQRTLRELHAVDFEDMINDSARALRECARLRQRLPFKYIIVDEYQDISRQRFDLTKALREVCDAKVIAVGDDWQSIYAFSGSDITLFTQFEKKMGPAAMLRIENTYRNAQELIDIAGSFVQKNPAQITKTLHSEKRIEDPVIIYSYDASRKGLGKNPGYRQNTGSGQNSTSGYNTGSGTAYNMGRAIEAALDHIVEKHSILPQNRELMSGN